MGSTFFCFYIYAFIKKHICKPITFNNPIKACFSNKKYTVSIQTQTKQIKYRNPGSNFLKDYCCTKQFGTALVCINI